MLYNAVNPVCCQMASSSTVSNESAGAGVSSSDVAASSRFIIAKMNPADIRQITMRMPHNTATLMEFHRSVGMTTR